ncbi:hypothetical protein [Natrinema sp. SYSU A 869]|uniref:hypothetical protein n=1 Tax=Natrinema sp. SYSU A 869 TaxID=2871694 RepID=UPI001CA3AD65|nr:hypothetical protein [Natrinema sp. SYSU A 869]
MSPSSLDEDQLETATLENDLLETLIEELQTLRAENERLTARIDDLEQSVDSLESRTETLETDHTEVQDCLEDHQQDLERVESLAKATRNRTGANKARLEELQARELEKGAHLRESNADVHELDIAADTLERFTKTDGRAYYRLPDHEDPLDRGNDVALAHGDLLPIQQLARMDEDMRRSTANALPTRLAAKLWQARTDSTVGDDPWKPGTSGVREYLEASDLKHWIRRQEQGISETYAKKLVSRTIDAILECANHRLAVRKRTQRKNGLEYTERRLVLPADAEIPGETTTDADQAPETADVHG